MLSADSYKRKLRQQSLNSFNDNSEYNYFFINKEDESAIIHRDPNIRELWYLNHPDDVRIGSDEDHYLETVVWYFKRNPNDPRIITSDNPEIRKIYFDKYPNDILASVDPDESIRFRYFLSNSLNKESKNDDSCAIRLLYYTLNEDEDILKEHCDNITFHKCFYENFNILPKYYSQDTHKRFYDMMVFLKNEPLLDVEYYENRQYKDLHKLKCESDIMRILKSLTTKKDFKVSNETSLSEKFVYYLENPNDSRILKETNPALRAIYYDENIDDIKIGDDCDLEIKIKYFISNPDRRARESSNKKLRYIYYKNNPNDERAMKDKSASIRLMFYLNNGFRKEMKEDESWKIRYLYYSEFKEDEDALSDKMSIIKFLYIYNNPNKVIDNKIKIKCHCLLGE